MMLASGQVCYGCSKAGASPLLVFLESAQIRPIRQRTTRATALEMAAQLPALQWYVWSPRHEDSARLHPGAQRPTARRQRFLFSFLCPHTATLGVSTRDPLAPASEAHAANSEGEDALAGEGSPVPPWLSRRSKSMGRADWHARIIRKDSSALSIVCRWAAGARARAAIRRRPLYSMRSIEASSSSMLSCDSILSEACLRSSALTVLRELVHEMQFP